MNIIQNFLANRTKPPRQPIANDAPQVTRAEFNALEKAVEGLIEDLGVLSEPGKLEAVLGNALGPLKDALTNARGTDVPARRAPLALKAERAALAPKDDDAAAIANRNKGRDPLALAPLGD